MAKTASKRERILDSILVVIFSGIIVALLVHYLASFGLVSRIYVFPIYSMIVLVAGYLVIRLVDRILERVVEPTLGATRTHGIKNAFQLIAGIVLIIFVFSVFGVNLTAALVGAGFLGIVLGLAAQQVLGNIFAGLSLLMSRPFEIGDHVLLATSSYGTTGSSYSHENQPSGFAGVVQDVGIFFTRVRLDSGVPADFPNSAVISSMVINYTKMEARVVRVRMDLEKKIDFDRFKSALLESLGKYDYVDQSKTRIEVIDVAAGTYQIVIEVSAKSESDEPIKTLVIREAIKVEEQLTN